MALLVKLGKVLAARRREGNKGACVEVTAGTGAGREVRSGAGPSGDS